MPKDYHHLSAQKKNSEEQIITPAFLYILSYESIFCLQKNALTSKTTIFSQLLLHKIRTRKGPRIW